MDALVLDLASVDATMPDLVGPKAANLGELARAGLPVPGGFCVTVDAYRAAAELAGVGALVEHPPGDPLELAAKARAALLAAPVPARVADRVARAYAALGERAPVAVRSSAAAEGLPFAGFDGQHDTYLDVVGVDAVLDAVGRCWASLWTDRAVRNRSGTGIGHRGLALAVVVQRQVDAVASGVMCTANPVTNRRREAVIDAGRWPGRAGAPGAAGPDRFVLGLDTGEIRERRPGAAGLTDGQLRGLVELGRRAEDDYGAPRDCGWALDAAGALWLTQARPVATLYPLPGRAGREAEVDPAGASAYLRVSPAQGPPRPLTPMGLSAFRLLGTGIAELAGVEVPRPGDGPGRLVVAGQRPFVDVTPALRHPLGRALLLGALDVVRPRSAHLLRGLAGEARFAVRAGSRWPLVRALGTALWRAGFPSKLAEALVAPDRARRRLVRQAQRRAAAATLPAGGAERLLRHVERVLRTELAVAMPGGLAAPAAGVLMLGLADRLLRDRRPAGDQASPSHGVPAELGFELGMDVPRWAGDPVDLFGMLADRFRPDDLALARCADRGGGPLVSSVVTDDIVRRLVATARARGRWRAVLVGFALRRAYQLAGSPELPTSSLVAGLASVRRALVEVGAELASAGRLADPTDVFFITLAEARRALRGADLRTLASVRRAEYERELCRRRVPEVLLSDGTVP